MNFLDNLSTLKKSILASVLIAVTALAALNAVGASEQKGLVTSVDVSSPEKGLAAERASAIAGSGYTVLGRTFLGESGNLSYLRFLNLSGTTATVNATLIGSPSGRNYGTAQVTVPNNASRQIPINQLMTSVGMVSLTSPDTGLAVFLQSGSEPVAVQHVLYSTGNGLFENLSSCQNSSLSDGNSALVNVHTTRIPDYTSFINIYNSGETTATYDIDIYNSESGANIGRVPVTIEPNAAFEQPFSYFETQLNFTPDASMFHANIVAFPRSGARTGSITHIVYNVSRGAFLNLTNFCTIAPTLSGRPIANSDNIAVPSSTQSFSIPFATLTANDSNATDATLISVTQPRTNGTANGTLVQSGNDLTFTPSRDGLATFEYRLRNALGDSSVATVTLNVGDGNDGGDDNTSYKLTMAKSGSGMGSVTSSPVGIECASACLNGTFDFNAGTTVTLTASPASGSTFLRWSGACSGTSITCNMVMNSNQSATASFALSANTLTVSKVTIASGTGTGGGSGTVTSSQQPGISCGNDCSFGFSSGTAVTLTAAPASGSTFVGWGGACSGVALTCTVAMSADQRVTASFGVPNYSLTVSKSGNGTVTSSQQPGISCGSACAFAFNSGTTVSLTATPTSGLNKDFRGWSGCASTSGDNGTICNVFMNSDKAVTATFGTPTSAVPTAFTLTVSKSSAGTVVSSQQPGISCGSVCTFTFSSGTTVTLTATPPSGLSKDFKGWSGCVSKSAENPIVCSLLMDANKSVTASF